MACFYQLLGLALCVTLVGWVISGGLRRGRRQPAAADGWTGDMVTRNNWMTDRRTNTEGRRWPFLFTYGPVDRHMFLLGQNTGYAAAHPTYPVA